MNLMLPITIAAALLLGSGAVSQDLPRDCPAYVYLGNNPGGNDDPDWSENAQGIANDGTHWYFTNEGALYKYEADWLEVDGVDVGRLGVAVIPPELTALGMDPFGDLDHYAVIPASGALKPNRYSLFDADLAFDRNTVGSSVDEVYTTLDSGGCNASQIADALGLGRSHYEHGLSRSTQQGWIEGRP